MRPARVLVTLGDPAGVGSELVAKLLVQLQANSSAHAIVLGDLRELEWGAAVAGVKLRIPIARGTEDIEPALARGGVVLLQREISADDTIVRASVSAAAGRVALSNLTEGTGLVAGGTADALLFAPLNKASLRAAGLKHNDEAHFFAEILGYGGEFCEVNVLDHLWTTRVTSHIGLRDVSDGITVASVKAAISIAQETLLLFGVEAPRIAVCGLNPHAGDSGMFGREEIDIIAPAIAEMRGAGLLVDGPFSADSIFAKAWAGAYDAVVTMYHDQGQIALKTLGMDRGVTIQGGQPIPIVTPAQGSAFDIVGRNLAKVDAIARAFEIAVTMGERRLLRK